MVKGSHMEEAPEDSPSSVIHRTHPPPPKAEGSWGPPHTHRALKFYAEEHHVGAKRFYGDTFGLHIGVLGTKKTSCKWASASSLGELLIWELPHPLRLGKPGAILTALPGSN